MKRTIWIEGCHWEVTGTIKLLEAHGIQARRQESGESPSRHDVIILACSSLPVLGWGRYLCRMELLVRRYRCTVITLHPPGMSVVPHTPRTYLCNGKVAPETLYHVLKHILSGLSGENPREAAALRGRGQTLLAELPGLSERFRYTEALLLSRSQKQQCHDIYRERQALSSRAGFRCIHTFRLFITGVYFRDARASGEITRNKNISSVRYAEDEEAAADNYCLSLTC